MEERGIIGLKNRGKTCYLNTSLQCLSHLPLLTDYFISNVYITDLNNNFNENKKAIDSIILAKEYGKLIKALWTSRTTIEPIIFHELIQKYNKTFKNNTEQDLCEILILLLDYLHEGLKYNVEINYSGDVKNELDELVIESIKELKKQYNNKHSIISELFYGQFINRFYSLENENKNEMITKNFELFSFLNLSVYGNTLNDCLKNFFDNEILDNYFDEKTKKNIKTYKQIKIIKIPNYLMIVLKRYKNSLLKKNDILSFPIDNLDLTEYSDGYEKLDCKLKLKSVGCHIGDFNSGHYFSICNHRNGNWYQYNDEIVSEFDIEKNSEILFKYGYVLIYEKINL